MTENDILTYLEKNLGVDVNGMTSETRLITSGLIDSFAFINLISYVEEFCDVRLDPEDVTIEAFDTIQGIINIFEKKTISAGRLL